jgi:hypothetical protein
MENIGKHQTTRHLTNHRLAETISETICRQYHCPCQEVNKKRNSKPCGNTRIPVEQLNGRSKASARHFDSEISILQLGLAVLLVRSIYLLQNFHPGFVQGRRETPEGGRPCRAEVRYYGATEDGLFDARPHYKLWATVTEQQRWEELQAQNRELSSTAISELVLNEDFPSKLLKQIQEIK